MTNTDDVWKRFCDIAATNFKGNLSRRDRIAMMFALECLRRQDVDRGMAVTSALHVLSCGGAESKKLKEAAVPVWYETTLRARLALALRVLLRVDEHSACDKHTSCCSSVGVYSPCPYRLEDASDPDNSGIPRRIHPLWEQAKELEADAEGRRVAREDRLRALGFEEPTAEQRKENLALNVALREWPKD